MSIRQSIDLDNISHNSPIAMGSKIGNMVFSSCIAGHDPKTHKVPADPDEQAKQMFQNIRSFMDKAGGTPENIAKVTIFIKDRQLREHINTEWVMMFPDPNSRPARHAIEYDKLPGDTLFQIELIAVL
jgi:2-iminobutanoate/2-iminopropanoate deaminase